MSLEHRDDRPAFGIDTWRSRSRAAGFTFAEMLVAVALAAFVLIAAVMAFQAAGSFVTRRSNLETVKFADTTVMSNFYGMNTNSVSVWSAPSYGHLARVEMLRDKYYEDVQKSTAVYCLPRAGRSSLRTSSLPIPTAYALGTYDFRQLSTPEAFRQFLAASVPATATVFTSNAYTAGSGSARGCNLSVLMLRKTSSKTDLYLHCTYEIDFVRPSSPGGIYASVRRYEGATCTDFYDVFYPDTETAQVNSDYFFVAAAFERNGRPTSTASAGNVAESQPFCLVWFPDPATPLLPAAAGTYLGAMADQTSLMFVTPMFPAL